MNDLELLRRKKEHLAPDKTRKTIDAALARIVNTETRRGLIMALDLTGSRESSLKEARIATASMLSAIKSFGTIVVKLAYFRGESECRATGWQQDAEIISNTMRRLNCEVGQTQIARILKLVLQEPRQICGAVYIGDHCEDEPGELESVACALDGRGIPLWVFHECADNDGSSIKAKPIFKRVAAMSGGAYVEFKPDSAEALREMLLNVGALTAAGLEGLRRIEAPKTPEARQLQSSLLMLAAPPSARYVPGKQSTIKPAGRFDLLRPAERK